MNSISLWWKRGSEFLHSMAVQGLRGLCESPEIPQGASPGCNHGWGGLEHFPRSVQTQMGKKQAGREMWVRVAMAPEQPARHSQHRARGWGAGQGGLGQPLTKTAPRFPARKRRFLPQKANLGGKWKAQGVATSAQNRRYNSLELRCMPRVLEYNSFPTHNSLLCSSGSLEESAVQKGEPFSSGPWHKQTHFLLNSQ